MADFFRALGSFFAGHIGLLVLLIILVIILMLIFYPLKYEVRGKYDDSFYLKGRLWWLFSIYGFDIRVAEKTRMWIHVGPFKKMLYGQKKTEAEEDKDKVPEEKKKDKEIKNDPDDDKKKNLPAAMIRFLMKKENRDYLKKVLGFLKKFLKKIAPKKIKANVRFSLGSPDKTGFAVAAAAVVPVIYWYDIALMPDFERDEQYLKTTFYVAGKISIAWMIGLVTKVLLQKQTREILVYIFGSKKKQSGG